MSKSPEMQQVLDGFSQAFFGNKRSEALENGYCVICKGAANEFHDELSRKEFGISGLCQKCQDKVFGGEE